MPNDQAELFYENWQDAARAVVRAVGGTKEVAKLLWPSKPILAASQRLTDSLNPGRDEKLSYDEILFLKRLGRDKNCHALAQFDCMHTGYRAPVALEPADEKVLLQRAFIESVSQQKQILERLERIGAPLKDAQ